MSLFYCSYSAYASHHQQTTSEDDPIIVLKKGYKDPSKKRPDTPATDNQLVTCLYSGGTLTLTFAESEGLCRGSISDMINGKIQLLTFDSSELIIKIETGNLDNFYIEFDTSNGNMYYSSSY